MVSFIIVILVFYTSANSQNYFNSKADPLNFNRESFGLIVSSDSNELQMIEANVVMEINETYREEGDFRIIFDGNYTIYNPNITTKTIIGAPFQSVYKNLSNTIIVEVDGFPMEYDIIYSDDQQFSNLRDLWKPYFEDLSFYYDIERCFVISNVTFPGFTNTTLRYRFDSIVSYGTGDGIEFAYDVSSARSWSNVTTEFVMFKVFGKQPRLYANRTEENYHNFTLSQIEGGVSYLWSWEQVIIQDDYVFVNFWPDDIFETTDFRLLIPTSLAIIILSSRKRKKSKSI